MRTLKAILFLLAAVPAAASAVPAAPEETRAATSQALRATYDQLRDRLAKSPFHQPLHIDAEEEEQHLKGDVHAVLAHPFAEASKALADPAQWCEIMLLPFNTKHCEAAGSGGRGAITLLLGRKHSTPIESTHRIGFTFEVEARSADYLRVSLKASEGPFSTRDYRIVAELTPLDERRTFVHFGYRYGYGNIARAAMRAYLATIGSRKVGFTVEGTGEDGRPALVRGMRAVMERNAMRYFLAMEAYLRSLRAPSGERVTRMIEDWHAAVERYPRQLHELDREEYLAMKRKEFQRMHAGVAPLGDGSRSLSPVPRTASSSPSPS